jgi:hypothetical protein
VEAQRRYSAPKITESEKKGVFGYPDWDLVSASYVERLNATTRLHMKQLVRLTLAFSKKRENFTAAVGLHFAFTTSFGVTINCAERLRWPLVLSRRSGLSAIWLRQ